MIVLQLAPGKMRLSRLQSSLPGVSTGVLERYVQQMVGLGLVTRMRFKEVPPRVELELTAAGRELLPVAGELARWGMRHMWSQAREQERIDVDCLLRLLPVLLEQAESGLPDGRVEAIATPPDPPIRYVHETKDGRVIVADGSDGTRGSLDAATARVEGSHRAWIAAFGPERDFAQLRVSGDEKLALSILTALHSPD